MESISGLSDEKLKRLMGADSARSDEAYHPAHTNAGMDDMQSHFARNYLMPSEKDVSDGRVKDFLRNGDVAMIIPMRERGPVTRPLLGVASQLMPVGNIYVIDDGSDIDACEEVRRHGAQLVAATEILDLIDWKRLLPILALDKRPSGKGVAVMAGYMLLYLLVERAGKEVAWICQHDSEIAEYSTYRGLEYLAWGALQKRNAHYVKMAKTGRGNESCMTARSIMRNLARLPQNPSVQKRLGDLFVRLAPHKWMLTGEFMMRWSLAMQRPFATGYLEETLISAFAEDVGAVTGQHTVQVANSNPRLDAANTARKEALMQDQISGFLMELGYEILPVNRWALEDIARLNHERMSMPEDVAWIPDDDGPVRYEEVDNNRILPSIAMLSEGEFIESDKAASFLEDKINI
jgi:hypothetical protein